MKLIDMVKDKQKVRFLYFRLGEMWYSTENGFAFPVPVAEVDNATLSPEEPAMLFMKFIKRQLEKTETAETN